ncbi:hypothetical protein BWI17_02920 [Betaproteobacteria bacterium GR16-43]|nr:hypothetical protein BWI17_02920 [Betaproteobacteria bacterium GR16-43]
MKSRDKPVACPECINLTAHEFRSPEDLINAVRVAAQEMDHGVIERVVEGGRGAEDERGAAEQESLESIFASGELPDTIRYRFRCTTCGAVFTLSADTRDGSGNWSREGT